MIVAILVFVILTFLAATSCAGSLRELVTLRKSEVEVWRKHD